MLARAARESHSHSTPTLRHTLTSNNSPKCARSGVELNTFLLWLQRAQHSHLTLPAPHHPLLLLVITRFHTHMHHRTATSPTIPVNSRLSSSLQEALQAYMSDHTRWSNTTGRLDRACLQNRTPRTDQPRWAQGTPVEALHGPNSMNRVTLKHWLCAHVRTDIVATQLHVPSRQYYRPAHVMHYARAQIKAFSCSTILASKNSVSLPLLFEWWISSSTTCP